MRILAIDPGGTTGWTKLEIQRGSDPQVRDNHTWASGELNRKKHHYDLYTLLGLTNPDILLWEQYRTEPGEGWQETIAIQYIGVIELWLQERRNRRPTIRTYSYPASKIKEFWTDRKLIHVGLYESGSTHIRDTRRQVLVYLTEQRNLCYVRMLRSS